MIEQPLGEILENYCNVEALGIDDLKEYLNKYSEENSEIGDSVRQFKEQLARAISIGTITSDEYWDLTDKNFRTQENLNKWLRELWSELYGLENPIEFYSIFVKNSS